MIPPFLLHPKSPVYVLRTSRASCVSHFGKFKTFSRRFAANSGTARLRVSAVDEPDPGRHCGRGRTRLDGRVGRGVRGPRYNKHLLLTWSYK